MARSLCLPVCETTKVVMITSLVVSIRPFGIRSARRVQNVRVNALRAGSMYWTTFGRAYRVRPACSVCVLSSVLMRYVSRVAYRGS
eukprot:4576683-Pyramimonas_sp.AAC.1